MNFFFHTFNVNLNNLPNLTNETDISIIKLPLSPNSNIQYIDDGYSAPIAVINVYSGPILSTEEISVSIAYPIIQNNIKHTINKTRFFIEHNKLEWKIEFTTKNNITTATAELLSDLDPNEITLPSWIIPSN